MQDKEHPPFPGPVELPPFPGPGVVPPAPSWDGEPVLVAAVLVTHDGVPIFHSS